MPGVVPTVTPVWQGAHLQEREAFDLMGIIFEGHPDLKRIFLWEGFPGHPLRKDFLPCPAATSPACSASPTSFPKASALPSYRHGRRRAGVPRIEPRPAAARRPAPVRSRRASPRPIAHGGQMRRARALPRSAQATRRRRGP